MKLMTKKKHNRKGFTLIELIVVLAILGILAAIAVPNFTAIQEDAKLKADTSTANSILKAARLQHFSDGLADNQDLGDLTTPGLKNDYFDASDVQVQSMSNNTYYLVAYGTTNRNYAIIWSETSFADANVAKTASGVVYLVKEADNDMKKLENLVTYTAKTSSAPANFNDETTDYELIGEIKP